MRSVLMLLSLLSGSLVVVLAMMLWSVYAGRSWALHVSLADPTSVPIAMNCPRPMPGVWFNVEERNGVTSCHAIAFR